MFLDHDDEVSESGGVGCAARARSEHDADLRHHTGVLRVAPEDFCITAHRAHAFLNARTARVDQRNEWHTITNRQIHHTADLV